MKAPTTTSIKRYSTTSQHIHDQLVTYESTQQTLTTDCQRLKDMKIMQRDPLASDKARRAERKADEKSGLITIKLGGDSSTNSNNNSGGGGGAKPGFKKGGFKSAFGPPAAAAEGKSEATVKSEGKSEVKMAMAAGRVEKGDVVGEIGDDDEEEVGYEYYDPRKPTMCDGGCRAGG